MNTHLAEKNPDIDLSIYDDYDTTEWYEVCDIPQAARQGKIVHRRGNSWDYSRIEEWDEYQPTETERAIMAANIQTRKVEARAAFASVPQNVLETIGGVVDSAMGNMAYQYGQFDKIDTKGMTSTQPAGLFESYEMKVAKPDGPGHIPGINTRSLTGGEAKPNAVEKMKHKAMVDGFDMMFPDDAMVGYMNYVLSEPFMWRDSAIRTAFESNWSNVVFKADRFVAAMVDSSGMENQVTFKSRTDLNDDQQMLDRNATGTPDNIHVRNVVAIQEFCADKPEYVVALFMWTHAMSEYCRDLKSYVRTEMGTNQQEIAKEAKFWDVVGLVEGGNNEMKHFVTHEPGEKWSNIDYGNKVAPTTGPNSFFFLAPVVSAVIGALLEESGIDYTNAKQRDIQPSTVKPAMEKLVLSGIFQRQVGTDTSPVLIRCPFAKKLKDMMTLDLGSNSDPRDSLFFKFVEKVRSDLKSPDRSASKHMEYVIGDQLKARVKAPKFGKSTVDKLKEHDAAKKGGCPFHKKP